MRAFGLTSITLAMLVPLAMSLEAGLLAMVIFEPFRGLFRRMQYLAVPFSTNEPIHLLTPIVAMFAVACATTVARLPSERAKMAA